jgi:thioesterase domain-containing protein
MEQSTRVEPCIPIHFQLMALWERLLSRQVDSVTASFIDLGGTPENAAAMLKEVEQQIGKTVSLDQFLQEPTIAALADAMLVLHQTDEVIEVQRGNGEVPFFYFHGDILGGGFYARTLARRLGQNRPVYILPPPRVSMEAMITIEEIAAARCRQIRKIRPHGPYIIGGFCISALVAYEVARQLVAAGEKVQSVVLVDPELPNGLERICRRAIERAQRGRRAPQVIIERFTAVNQKLSRLQYVWHSPLSEKIEFIVGNTKKLFRRRPARAETSDCEAPVANPDVTRDGWRVDVFQWMATAYKLQPYPGRVTILITDEQRQARPSLVRTWSRMVSELRVSELPGRHMTAITTSQAALAARIRTELQTMQSMVTAVLSSLAIA